ncbi:hypothetical protein CRENBAI_020577 [Crenichthys baileyi]|uniref:Uncharacterized protein n=1 Tax=Crenichthys baileyi TaxID=28760 RepID=A0AAV9SH45_9TELE
MVIRPRCPSSRLGKTAPLGVVETGSLLGTLWNTGHTPTDELHPQRAASSVHSPAPGSPTASHPPSATTAQEEAPTSLTPPSQLSHSKCQQPYIKKEDTTLSLHMLQPFHATLQAATLPTLPTTPRHDSQRSSTSPSLPNQSNASSPRPSLHTL